MDELADYFAEDVAATYDDAEAEMFRPDTVGPVVEVLARLAGSGRALEFGIGTGRIALPLTGLGIEVHGIDLPTAMVGRLRAKSGGDAIGVTIGDFATTRLDGSFRVAYLVFNTIMNLTTQAAQVACFANAAAHLEPGGSFVIETVTPDLRRLPPGQDAVPFRIEPANWAFDVYDVATQQMSSNYGRIVDGRLEYYRIPFRYVWPSELDLMAQLAGLVLQERWEDWTGAPFTGESRQHVSIWAKPGRPSGPVAGPRGPAGAR